MTYLEMSKPDQQRVRAAMLVEAQKSMRDAGYGRAASRFGARRMVDEALATERQKHGNPESSDTQQLAN